MGQVEARGRSSEKGEQSPGWVQDEISKTKTLKLSFLASVSSPTFNSPNHCTPPGLLCFGFRAPQVPSYSCTFSRSCREQRPANTVPKASGTDTWAPGAWLFFEATLRAGRGHSRLRTSSSISELLSIIQGTTPKHWERELPSTSFLHACRC